MTSGTQYESKMYAETWFEFWIIDKHSSFRPTLGSFLLKQNSSNARLSNSGKGGEFMIILTVR